MNIRQSLKAATVALPLMFGTVGEAAAQKSTNVVKATKTIAAGDTLKTMDNAAADARAMVLNKLDSIARSKADSIALTKYDSISGKQPRFAADISYIGARHLPTGGVRVHGEARKNKDIFDATGVFSGKHMRATMYADGSYTRMFPVSKNDSTLHLTGSVGGTATVVRTHNPVSDQYGVYSPRLAFGVRYKDEVANGVMLRAKAEAGPALNIKSVAQTHSDNNKVKGAFYLNAEVEAGSKTSMEKHPQVSAVIGGGHHPFVGANIYGGFKYKF